jgi:hypothetical protein
MVEKRQFKERQEAGEKGGQTLILLFSDDPGIHDEPPFLQSLNYVSFFKQKTLRHSGTKGFLRGTTLVTFEPVQIIQTSLNSAITG